ncbi:voltage-gated sodium channel [Nocardioides albertanoniae]|uniref:Voltage-gated sodium channel n=1 Tax=Nocardioides albertanoniae TaxID=1175486 RepID=A0A543A550_9ACTN|nr:ion transporter [Nocardioides albertanoniae]TQL67606.1 voltage-gated sodium channel [Nocardioides albertanoniae]
MSGNISVRTRVRTLVDDERFQKIIIGVIILNAVVLGVETMVPEHLAHELALFDSLLLAVFVVELLLRLVAYGPRFFLDPWNVFDTVIVAIALVPATGPLSVLRALRILRVLRLVNSVPSMRRVVDGLINAMPGMGAVAGLLVLMMYVAVVISTNLYGEIAPEYFGDLGTSAFTLFQTMTGEAWPDIARTVMAEDPTAWVFFVVFILVMTFAVLNLFLAVVVSGMESVESLAEHEEESDAEMMTLLTSMRDDLTAVREELAAVRAERSQAPEAG